MTNQNNYTELLRAAIVDVTTTSTVQPWTGTTAELAYAIRSRSEPLAWLTPGKLGRRLPAIIAASGIISASSRHTMHGTEWIFAKATPPQPIVPTSAQPFV